MEIPQQQDRSLALGQPIQAGQGCHGIAGGFSLAVRCSAQAIDEIPAQQAAATEPLGCGLQQHLHPFLLQAADPEDRGAGANQQVELISPDLAHAGGGLRI